MKVTFVGHAAILVESRGISILSDPWWDAPCFGAQWWNYPRSIGERLESRRLDYIYISHGHHDHLHPGTLRRLHNSATVLMPAGTDMPEAVRRMGFSVREIQPADECDVGNGVRVRILPTHGGDSLMVVSDGEETCVNLNDALHAAPESVQRHFVRMLRDLYPRIDYCFCGYGVASHFPNCYVIPGKNREATAVARQEFFSGRWAEISSRLAPRFAMPFAADVVLLEDALFWANVPTHNAERPTQILRRRFPAYDGTAIDIAPGFVIENGRVVENRLREPASADVIREQMAGEIEKANQFGTPDRDRVDGLRQLLEENIGRCRAYLESYEGDYRILIRFPKSSFGILVRKRSDGITALTLEDARSASADLTFTTRAQYLRTSLTRPYGHETIMVGSGGLFEYPGRAQMRQGLRAELAVMIRVNEALPVRAPPARSVLARAKRILKRMLGREETELYDLDAWTVWD